MDESRRNFLKFSTVGVAGLGLAVPVATAIGKALTLEPHETLRRAVTAYATSQEGRPDREHVPYPATWFNQRRWQDNPSEWMAWRQTGTGRSAPAQQARNPRGAVL